VRGRELSHSGEIGKRAEVETRFERPKEIILVAGQEITRSQSIKKRA
jgi:hypothetical protein